MTYNFGLYHWRERGRRLLESVGLCLVAGSLWTTGRGRGRGRRLLAAVTALAGFRRGYRAVRNLCSPPPWVIERDKYDALARELPLSGATHVLDVGCGTGRSLVGLAPWVADGTTVLGLDVFDDRIILGNAPALARRNAERAGLEAAVVAGDASRLPVATDSQDVVTACRVLHDLPRADAERALAESRRVCKPTGVVGVLELHRTHGTDADPLEYWRDLVADGGFDVRHADRVVREGAETGYVVVVAEPVH